MSTKELKRKRKAEEVYDSRVIETVSVPDKGNKERRKKKWMKIQEEAWKTGSTNKGEKKKKKKKQKERKKERAEREEKKTSSSDDEELVQEEYERTKDREREEDPEEEIEDGEEVEVMAEEKTQFCQGCRQVTLLSNFNYRNAFIPEKRVLCDECVVSPLGLLRLCHGLGGNDVLFTHRHLEIKRNMKESTLGVAASIYHEFIWLDFVDMNLEKESVPTPGSLTYEFLTGFDVLRMREDLASDILNDEIPVKYRDPKLGDYLIQLNECMGLSYEASESHVDDFDSNYEWGNYDDPPQVLC